jgi:hypothetical protein
MYKAVQSATEQQVLGSKHWSQTLTLATLVHVLSWKETLSKLKTGNKCLRTAVLAHCHPQ